MVGYEDKALAAKEEILGLVKDLESQVSREVRVDARVHPRLIGQRGRSIRKIMEQFHVDVKFPRESDSDPNIITISGHADDVDAAKDHILNLEEEYVSGTSLKLTSNTMLSCHSSKMTARSTRRREPQTLAESQAPGRAQVSSLRVRRGTSSGRTRRTERNSRRWVRRRPPVRTVVPEARRGDRASDRRLQVPCLSCLSLFPCLPKV